MVSSETQQAINDTVIINPTCDSYHKLTHLKRQSHRTRRGYTITKKAQRDKENVAGQSAGGIKQEEINPEPTQGELK